MNLKNRLSAKKITVNTTNLREDLQFTVGALVSHRCVLGSVLMCGSAFRKLFLTQGGFSRGLQHVPQSLKSRQKFNLNSDLMVNFLFL